MTERSLLFSKDAVDDKAYLHENIINVVAHTMCIIFTLDNHAARSLDDILARQQWNMVCSERHTGNSTSKLHIVKTGAVPRDMHSQHCHKNNYKMITRN